MEEPQEDDKMVPLEQSAFDRERRATLTTVDSAYKINAKTLCEKTLSERFKDLYPTKLLRANFVVDLMHEVGDLLPIGSTKAKEYCGARFEWKTPKPSKSRKHSCCN